MHRLRSPGILAVILAASAPRKPRYANLAARSCIHAELTVSPALPPSLPHRAAAHGACHRCAANGAAPPLLGSRAVGVSGGGIVPLRYFDVGSSSRHHVPDPPALLDRRPDERGILSTPCRSVRLSRVVSHQSCRCGRFRPVTFTFMSPDGAGLPICPGDNTWLRSRRPGAARNDPTAEP